MGGERRSRGVTTYLGNTSCFCSRLRSWAGTRSRAGRFCRGLLQSSSPCGQTRNTIGGGAATPGPGAPPSPLSQAVWGRKEGVGFWAAAKSLENSRRIPVVFCHVTVRIYIPLRPHTCPCPALRDSERRGPPPTQAPTPWCWEASDVPLLSHFSKVGRGFVTVFGPQMGSSFPTSQVCPPSRVPHFLKDEPLTFMA